MKTKRNNRSFIINTFIISIILLLVGVQANYAQLTITVTSTPNTTPSNSDIYIAGNHNSWNPGDSDYTLTDNGDGSYQITFTPAIGTLEYKFTRGSWESVEVNEQGLDIANRTLNYGGGTQTEEVDVLNWKDVVGMHNSTRTENVSIISESFEIPQLNRTRRIWIYLPKNYDSSNETYPVLYMHDGQNLFDASTSFSGEWGVDESLNELFGQGTDKVIVVGIDNGGNQRINEYTPWTHPSYGGGEGDKYVDFIVETLKPYIDSNYRTKSDRNNTGIMGSSLGALISFYAAIEHQDVFSKVGVFSPSFWFSTEVYSHVQSKGKKEDVRFYMIGGVNESERLINDMQKMVTTLKEVGFEDSEIKMVTHQDGEHSEWYWKREFPGAYLWLFHNIVLALPATPTKDNWHVSPNPFKDSLSINYSGNYVKAEVKIYHEDGKLVYDDYLPVNGQIPLLNFRAGIYILKIMNKGEILFTEKIICE